jgi:hypothetical protein
MPEWRIYIPKFFEYMFLRRSNSRLMCAMNLHDADHFVGLSMAVQSRSAP